MIITFLIALIMLHIIGLHTLGTWPLGIAIFGLIMLGIGGYLRLYSNDKRLKRVEKKLGLLDNNTLLRSVRNRANRKR